MARGAALLLLGAPWGGDGESYVTRTLARPRAPVVATSFALRGTFAAALEAEGWLALEAASVEEVLWRLAAARLGDERGIDLLLVDAELHCARCSTS